MMERRKLGRVRMDQSPEPALVDDDYKLFKLCPDQQEHEFGEDPNYKRWKLLWKLERQA